MSEANSAPRPILLSLLVLLGVAILIGLGLWQIERKAWKEDLIRRYEASAALPAVALPDALDDPASWDYRKVTLAGQADFSRLLRLYAIDKNGAPGYRAVYPVLRGRDAVLAVGGWIGEDAPSVSPKIAGVARLPKPRGPFQPANDAAKNEWMWIDLEAMGASLDLDLAPVYVDAGGAAAPVLTNNHLSYALTWFALAAALLGVYAAFLRSQFKARRDA